MSNSKQQRVTQNRILLLLLALTLIRGLIYASVTIPWWMGHDEDFHFAQSRSLVDQWTSANPGHQNKNWPQEMVATFAAFPLEQWHEQPIEPIDLTNIPDRYTGLIHKHSLSYYPYAWFGKFLTHQDLLFQLFAFRVISVFITCSTIFFAFLSAKQIFTDSPMMQLLVPWLIIFNPSFMVINSAINDGNLTVLLSTIIFYLLLKEIAEQRIGWQSAVALGLTIFAIWTKPTAYFLLFVWSVLIFVQAWKFGWKYWLWGGILGGLFITLLFLFPFRFLDMIAAYRQYNVSIEGVAYALSAYHLWLVFASFWIILGHAVYPLASVWYIILLHLSLFAVIGLFIYVWYFFKKNGFVLGTEQKSLLLSSLFVGVAIAGLLGLAVLRYDEQEGRLARYIFPTIVPLSILMVAGWRALLPAIWRNVGLLFIASAFFLFDTMVWLIYAIPWYYPFWPY